MDDNKTLLLSLVRCEVVKVGNFKLKSGAFSPVYIDLRRIIHYPDVVKKLATAVRAKQMELNLHTNTVCGVPYTALPVASVFSVFFDVPMVMKRKEAKDYGTKRMVEGCYRIGDSCLIIEDIISSGTSIVETAEALRKEGLDVQNCIVIIDRMQGGIKNTKEIGVNVYPLFNIDMIVSLYCSINKVETEIIENIRTYFKENSNLPVHKSISDSSISFAKRANTSCHPVAKQLFNIMEEKKTNLCVAVDTNLSNDLLKLTEQLGPYICLLKTHIDILDDFSDEIISKLSNLAVAHNFLILEDRKFADIGNTVVNQYKNGIYKIQKWADLVTVHGIPGNSIIGALKSAQNGENRACVLIAEMSSQGALTNDDYKESITKIAETNSDFVIGYVGQHRNIRLKNMIHMCPGINIGIKADSLGQQYILPEEAVANGADIIIVGRGICKAPDVVASAIEYKTRGFNAYLERIS